jgi:hypothetical protein
MTFPYIHIVYFDHTHNLYYPFSWPLLFIFSPFSVLMVSLLFFYHSLIPKISKLRENIWKLSLWYWFISLNMMISSFIHFLTNETTSFFFMTEFYDLHRPQFTHSFSDEYLRQFHNLAVVNSATINMGVQIELMEADFELLEYILRGGIDRSYRSFIFKFLRSLHTNFHSCWTNMYFHHQC